MAGLICDACVKDDIPTLVSSSSLGPISFAYCGICASMGAEPKWCVEESIEMCGGIENVRKGLLLTYYDNKTDSYIDKRKGKIPIVFKDGSKLNTRTEVIARIR